MKQLLQFFKFILIAEVGPAILTILNIVFTAFYWGPGLIVLAMALIMIPVSGIGGIVINGILKKRSVFDRIFYTSIFAFLIGFSLQLFQFYNSTPNKLKTAVLIPELERKFNATRGKLLYAGGEHEIYVELESTPVLTKEFLKSRDFILQDIENNYQFSYGPEWFPKQVYPHFKMYDCTEFSTEENYTAFISNDLSRIYVRYLAY